MKEHARSPFGEPGAPGVVRLADSFASFLSRPSRRDGRLVVLLALALYFAALWAASLLVPYKVFWRNCLGVPALSPSFLDLRVITSAIECRERGYDPLVENPCDSLRRPMDYPRMWLELARIGVGERTANLTGCIEGVLFFASVFLFIGPVSLREGLCYAVVLCSPSVMLAVERGNNDIVIFALLCLSVFLLQHGPPFRLLGYAGLLFGGVLKLYPILAVAAVLKERPKVAIAVLLTAGVLFGAYVACTASDIAAIRAASLGVHSIAYGAVSLFILLRRAPDATNFPSLRMYAAAWISVAALAVAAWGLARWIQTRLDRSREVGGVGLDAFRCGAPIFLGTFAMGGSNSYRLIMLALVLPALLAWLRRADVLKYLAAANVFLIVLFVWTATLPVRFRFGMDKLASWCLFLLLAAAFLVTLPAWVQKLVGIPPLGESGSASEP
jgi:hypothetical protein